MRRRPLVQPLWKDMILFALIVGFPWSIAALRDFHSGWFVYACVITPLMVVALVLRRVGIISRIP